MKKIFLSFADSRMKESLRRIKSQAESISFYDQIIVCDQKSLEKSFYAKFRKHLVAGSRGFGYWCWKPQIILQTLEDMNEGDILQYTDAGCHINAKGLKRLNDYFDLTNKSSSGILAFQAKKPTSPLIHDGRPLIDLPDYQWIKGDLIEHFGVRHNPEILNSPTIGAGILFIRKCDKSISIIKKWLAVFEHDFSLIDDTPSKNDNMPGFIENRHDQSVFSILCKLHKIDTLSAFEYWYSSKHNKWDPDWEALEQFPIHARRDKVIKNNLINKLNFKLKSLRKKASLRIRIKK